MASLHCRRRFEIERTDERSFSIKIDALVLILNFDILGGKLVFVTQVFWSEKRYSVNSQWPVGKFYYFNPRTAVGNTLRVPRPKKAGKDTL